MVLPPQVALPPHEGRVLHEDTISLAFASGNKAGLPIPSTVLQDEQDFPWAATFTPLVVFSWRSRYPVRLNPRLPATTGYPLEYPLPTMP